MQNVSVRERLIAALMNISDEMRMKLNELRQIAAQLVARDDIVWYILLQSMSGMGNNRGYDGLMLNPANLRRVMWELLKSMTFDQRYNHLRQVLRDATCRRPDQKAQWLSINYECIESMGGLNSARDTMYRLSGQQEKLNFIRQFAGIGEKYGHNIWMDLCDPDFIDSIAIDVRIGHILSALEVDQTDYRNAERALTEIAHKAGLTGWELDRLLFHFLDHFTTALGLQINKNVSHKKSLSKISKQVLKNHKVQQMDLSDAAYGVDCESVIKQWGDLYQIFLKRQNTSGWGKKKDYVRRIVDHFQGSIPLADIVSAPKRKQLATQLFNEKNDFNFITYPIGMGVFKEVLRREGEVLIVAQPDKLRE
jgi:hypothetical protein